MSPELRVVVFTHDNSVLELLQGLVGIDGEVLLEDEASILNAHLVCIDFSYTHRNIVLDSLSDYSRTFVVAVISANPFAISQLEGYNVDAFLGKPLNSESVQAVLVGTKARLLSKENLR